MIATVLNEYGSLPAWFGGLARQTFVPDECVIVDGGSTDGTLEYLRSASAPFPTRIISAPGSNISTGRNIAIEHTSAEIIATTDAGTVADIEWLEKLIRPFERRRTDVVAGFFRPSYSSLWEEALAASTIPDLPEIDASHVLASSRSFAFRRSWFEQGFVYPEWLDFCEDVVLEFVARQGWRLSGVRAGRVCLVSARGDTRLGTRSSTTHTPEVTARAGSTLIVTPFGMRPT